MTNDKMTKDINRVSVISDMGDGFFLVSTNGNLRRVSMNDTALAKKLVELAARMDQFTSLEEGSAAGDAELADIRIGFNGQEYPTAGDAVREQARTLDMKKMPLSFAEHIVAEGEEVHLIEGVDINAGEFEFQYVAREGFYLAIPDMDPFTHDPVDKDGMLSMTLELFEGFTSLTLRGAYFSQIKASVLEEMDEVSEDDYMVVSDGRGTYTIKMSVLKSFLGIDEVTQKMVTEIVNEYLKLYGIHPGATEMEAAQIYKNKGDIEKLADQVAELLHMPIEITSISHDAGTKEIGDTVTALTISWRLNGEPVYQELRDEELDVTARSKTFTGLEITTNSTVDEKTFTLNVTDERGHTDNASTTITFVNGLYWGVVEDETEIDSSVIQELNKILKDSKDCSFTIDTPISMRIVFALPSRLGTPSFTSGGFVAAMYKAKTFEFENHRGYREEYDVWLSQELVNNANGVIPMEVH